MAGSSWTNQVVSLLIIQSAGNFQGLFVYSPTPGAGNLIGSWASQAGTDPYGNAYPQGLYATSVTFNLSGGRLLVYANETLTATLTSGTHFTFPGALLGGVVNCRAVGAGGGGGSVGGGTGGGGGEDAQETALAVTAGHTYTYSIGTGGAGSTGSGAGAGTNTTFTGDSVTVTAHGGGAGHDFPSAVVGAGGTGSTNSVHHDGGAGGSELGGPLPNNGGGGGSSGGTSASGNPGADGSSSGGSGAGGIAPAGGGNGGNGGNNASSWVGTAGSVPGGGGGGGGDGPPSGNGAAGANGQIVLVYQVSNDLIASIAPTASSDSGGNAYPTGFGGQLNAFQPATYPSVVEAWHLATPLSNSWAASGAGVNGMFYRLLGSPPNTVQIIADITGGAANTVCFTMPLGYIPGVAQNHASINYVPVANVVPVSIATNGQITIGNTGPVAFNIFVPLDGSL